MRCSPGFTRNNRISLAIFHAGHEAKTMSIQNVRMASRLAVAIAAVVFAHASNAADQGPLEEITVTAQKRVESLRARPTTRR